MKEFMDVCLQAARAGGQVLDQMRDRFTTREKAVKDLVTDADFAAQRKIQQIILEAFPDHGFVGEEDTGESVGSSASQPTSDYCWIVDPLDGTMNYVHQLPGYAVSVALRYRDELLVGVVFDPVLDECFAASRGNGATLNGVPIRASDCRKLREALIAVSLPAQMPRGSVEIARLVEVLHEAQAIRLLGSAALNMSYMAMGRLDGYWATAVKPWDVAAGALIASEAGAVLSHFDGGPFNIDDPRFIGATTPELHRALVATLGRAQGI